jgi:hypothetical protein
LSIFFLLQIAPLGITSSIESLLNKFFLGEGCEVQTFIRFGGESVEHGGRDVFYRVGGMETIIGVGGGDVGGVS